MNTKDVFTPGRFPTLTFVGDHLKQKADQLRGAIETGGLLISISGPSKSGKTVFIENEIGKDNLIHVTGAGIDSAPRLWQRVFDLVGAPLTEEKSSSKGFAGSVAGKVGGEAGLFVKGSGEIGASGSWQNIETSKIEIEKDPLQLAIRDLRDSGFFLFIDDFHYVQESAKQEIAQQLKECIRQGVNVIVASVPYHSDDVIRSNSDLRGRMLKLDFDYWDKSELSKIAVKGFGELAIEVAQSFIMRLVDEAAGSPQLMQSLCLNLCFEKGIYKRCEVFERVSDDELLFANVCRRTALMTDFSSTVALMKDGPKTRGTVRHLHRTKSFGSIDVYPLVLRAIAKDPPILTFRYPDLTDRIYALCEDDGPVGSSITGACNHMARIANDFENGPIVEWDSEHDVFDIRDPYFLFYLRWN